jgi:hypothetical protein
MNGPGRGRVQKRHHKQRSDQAKPDPCAPNQQRDFVISQIDVLSSEGKEHQTKIGSQGAKILGK